jgi:hypothetical protein
LLPKRRQKSKNRHEEKKKTFHPKLLGKVIGEYIGRKVPSRLHQGMMLKPEPYSCSDLEPSDKIKIMRRGRPCAELLASGAEHTDHIPEPQARWSEATK